MGSRQVSDTSKLKDLGEEKDQGGGGGPLSSWNLFPYMWNDKVELHND